MSYQPWLAGTLAMAMLAGVSQAQHADIEIELDGTAIEIHEPHVDEELWTSILTNPATQFSTADWPAPTTIFPGIEAEDGSFPAASGNIYFQPLSQLYFHDGTAGGPVGNTPADEQIVLLRSSSDAVAVSNAGPATLAGGDLQVKVGAIDGDGGLHAHLTFELNRAGGSGNPAVGAYLMQLQVNADNFDSSEPMWALWNHGLSEAEFGNALAASEQFTGVPEPTTLAVVGIGSLLMLARRRTARRA